MSTTTMTDLTIAPNQGTSLQVLADTLRVLTQASHTAETYELFELIGPLNSGPPAHHHPWSETYYVLDGEVEILINTETVLGTPGYCVNIPGGMVHTYRIASDTARFLVITSTSAASAFFKDLQQATAAGSLDLGDVITIATRHQVQLGAA